VIETINSEGCGVRSFFDLTVEEFGDVLAGFDPRPFRVGQILRWVYRMGAAEFSSMTDIPADLRESLSGSLDLNPMREIERQEARDGTVKFLHVLGDGATIESVLIPDGEHHTLCVSTQAGCAMSCAFCETGRTGQGRNLTAGEIVAQVVYGFRFLGSRLALRNLVFMGMGEPLVNPDALLPALNIILSGRALDFSPRRVTVSTCGWVPGIDLLGSMGLDVNLAVSLNAADDKTRSRIMPVNLKYPLPELMKAIRRYPVKAGRRITFEYVLIDHVNDSPEDASKLADLLKGIPAKINLIPCNANSSSLKAPDPQRTKAFQEALMRKGMLATLRTSRGGEIMAACGQLKKSANGASW
jgi:23S rRNA (adenine2503-C2)-methyltransferase